MTERRADVRPAFDHSNSPSDEMLLSAWGECVQALQIWQARLYCRRPKTEECAKVSDPLPPPQWRPFLWTLPPFEKSVSLPPLFIPALPEMPIPARSRTSSFSAPSSDDDECLFSPFSKREYLLAQMKQKDELIDSLVKQVRLSQHAIKRFRRPFLTPSPSPLLAP